MLTSKELLNVAEARGLKLTYSELRKGMFASGIIFKARRIAGMVIRTYLTPGDVCQLGVFFDHDFNAKLELPNRQAKFEGAK